MASAGDVTGPEQLSSPLVAGKARPGTRRAIYAASLLIVLALPFILRSDYQVFISNVIILNSAMALSVVFMMRTGRLPLAQAALVGVGAYFTSGMATHFGWPIWATLPISAMLAAFCGFVLGLLSLRLRGFFFTVATMAFSEIFYYTVSHLKSTGRDGGIQGVPSMGTVNIGDSTLDFSAGAPLFYVLLLFLSLTLYVVYRLGKSRFGDAIASLGEDDDLAQTLGVDRTRYRLLACVIGSAIAGAAGTFYAYVYGGAAPTSFDTLASVSIVLMCILGGVQFLFGPVFGAALLIIATIVTRASTEISLLLYGLVFLVVVYLAPDGVIARFFQVRKFVGRRAAQWKK